MPPLNLFVLATVGWLLSRRWLHIGHAVIGTGVIFLYLLLTPYVSSQLLRSLQRYPALTAASLTNDAGAIVVLSGDVYRQAPEYDHHAVGPLTLMRLQYGAWLYRRLQLPILVTGGKQRGTERSLAELMRETLVHDFRLPVRWVEPASRNTYENAKFSAQILKTAGIRKIYLVTHAWHMPRAKACFEALDIEIIPAPTHFASKATPEAVDFLPTTHAFNASYFALYEWFGRLWYDFYYY